MAQSLVEPISTPIAGGVVIVASTAASGIWDLRAVGCIMAWDATIVARHFESEEVEKMYGCDVCVCVCAGVG